MENSFTGTEFRARANSRIFAYPAVLKHSKCLFRDPSVVRPCLVLATSREYQEPYTLYFTAYGGYCVTFYLKFGSCQAGREIKFFTALSVYLLFRSVGFLKGKTGKQANKLFFSEMCEAGFKMYR